MEGGPVGHKLNTRGPCIFFIFSWVGGPEGHKQGATNCRASLCHIDTIYSGARLCHIDKRVAGRG